MIWAMLITMAIKLVIGTDEIFTIPKLKKEIKKHVTDDRRKDSLLLILKDAKREIKAFNKQNIKDMKKVKKLMASEENQIQELEILLKSNFDKRKKLQASKLDKRLAMQDLMTDEEWKSVIENAVTPSRKHEKKTNKKVSKFKKSVDELLNDTEKSISKKIHDSVRREKVLESFHEFFAALEQQIEEGSKFNYKSNEIIRKRSATREELEGLYAKQNELRKNVYSEFRVMYEVIFEFTNETERKAIRKELKKMFK